MCDNSTLLKSLIFFCTSTKKCQKQTSELCGPQEMRINPWPKVHIKMSTKDHHESQAKQRNKFSNAQPSQNSSDQINTKLDLLQKCQTKVAHQTVPLNKGSVANQNVSRRKTQRRNRATTKLTQTNPTEVWAEEFTTKTALLGCHVADTKHKN